MFIIQTKHDVYRSSRTLVFTASKAVMKEGKNNNYYIDDCKMSTYNYTVTIVPK